jgi:signal transduction histidine kinase/ActR/RegA family two-component response regulator
MPDSSRIASNRRLSAFLLGGFLLSFLSIAAIGFVIEEISGDLERKLANQKVRLGVSEQILANIQKVESLLFQMAPAGRSAVYRRNAAQILDGINLLEHHISVLQKGGQVVRVFDLNVMGVERYESAAIYKPESGTDVPILEVIELLPFVERIKNKTEILVTLLERRDRCMEFKEPCQQESMLAVRNFYKELPPFFYRLIENANRQHMEGLQRIDHLQRQLEDKKKNFYSLQLTLIIFVIIFGAGMTGFFLRRINAAQLQAEMSRERAEEASLAKTRFLATMSHEIRTPMNGILGMVQILEDDQLTLTQRRDNLRVIKNSGNTLMQLLNDILDLAKVEAGKMQLRYVHTSPLQLVEDTVALFVDMANAKGLELVATSEVISLFRYDLDADRLRQMIGNLVNNAIKFTESGRIRVNVSLVAEHDAPAMLEFSVEDTGVGILLEHQDSLFKRFTQIDASSTRSYDGSGLGLYIVRQFAQMMGGKVGFESTFGKGSRFWFRVLANEITVEQLVSNHQPRMSSEVAKNTLTGHVLVAEDNPTNRVILKTMLNRMGLTVRLVEDGQVAFEAYTSGASFDAVLMDISMPRMDGLEATRQIRWWEQKEAHERCPIIAITANAYSEDRQACLDAGMDDFIAKPIMVDQLADCLAKRLR